MKRIYKNIFLLFIFFTINIFSSKDAIIAPKKYKPAEMNLEITKVKLKEIEGTINEVKKELYISKKDLTVDTDDILFITEEKNKLRENFNFQKKDILNNENYVFSYKQHKDNIYLVHSDKEKIKGIYKINILSDIPILSESLHLFILNNTIQLKVDGTVNSITGSNDFLSGGGFTSNRTKFLLDKNIHIFSNNLIWKSLSSEKVELQFKDDPNKIFTCLLEQVNDSHSNTKINFIIPKDFNASIHLKVETNNTFPSKYRWIIIKPGKYTPGSFSMKVIKNIDFGSIVKTDKNIIASGAIDVYNSSSFDYEITLQTNTPILTCNNDSKNFINSTLYFKTDSSNTDKTITSLKDTTTNVDLEGILTDSTNANISGLYKTIVNINATQQKAQGGKF